MRASIKGRDKTIYLTELSAGTEDPARLLLLNIGAWAHELHDEVWVFNQGYWSKDRGLWNEIQKADWKDVILKEDFKKSLQKDIYGFFSAEEVYKKLAVPWKVYHHLFLSTCF
jgi:transitional endoplasmic reticulum ATPase